MNALVKITNEKELVVSIADISKGTEMSIGAILKTIERHYKPLLTKLPKGSHKDKLSLNLSEEEAYKLLVLLPNSTKVLEFKIALVDEFFRMREFLKKGTILSDEMKKQIEQFLPKGGFLEENTRGCLKTKPIRGYYRFDRNSEEALLLNKKYQLQKRLNGLLREEYEIEIRLIEMELEDIAIENNQKQTA